MFGISPKWIVIGGTVIAIAVFGTMAIKGIREQGALGERVEIQRQNKEAGDAGENARLNLHECHARGLQYDYVTGKCES